MHALQACMLPEDGVGEDVVVAAAPLLSRAVCSMVRAPTRNGGAVLEWVPSNQPLALEARCDVLGLQRARLLRACHVRFVLLIVYDDHADAAGEPCRLAHSRWCMVSHDETCTVSGREDVV